MSPRHKQRLRPGDPHVEPSSIRKEAETSRGQPADVPRGPQIA